MQSHKITALQTLLFLITLEAQLILATPRWSWSLFPRRQGRAIDNLHSGEHCVDVSTYEPVAFKDVTVEVCDSTFEKTCEQKTDQVRKEMCYFCLEKPWYDTTLCIYQVCLEVSEMECDVVAYTDCQMTMEEVPYKSYDMVKGEFFTKTCKEGTEIVQEIKSTPECK